jgi:tetratricopeptide (TPR) repeat protein
MQKQEIERAEKYFNEALSFDPNDDVSLGWLGEIYSTRGGARDGRAAAVPEHLDKAMGYYDKVIAIKPDSLTAYVNKRIILVKYATHEQRQKEAKEQEAKDSAGDKAAVEAAKAAAEKHQARIDELKKQVDEVTKLLTAAQKKAAPPQPPPAPQQ